MDLGKAQSEAAMLPAFVSRVPRWLVGLGSTALLYGALNIVLIGGQKWWHSSDQKRLDEIRAILAHEKPEIEALGVDVKHLAADLERSSGEIDQSKADIEAFEARFSSGIPSVRYAGYSRTVDAYNSKVEKYNARFEGYEPLYNSYSARVDKYNTLVREANALSKVIGGTWYVVPVPLPTKSGVRARR